MSDPIRDYSMKHSAGLDEVVLDMNYYHGEKLVVSIPKQMVVNMMPRLLPPLPPVSLVPVLPDTTMLCILPTLWWSDDSHLVESEGWNALSVVCLATNMFNINLAAQDQAAWLVRTTLPKRPHHAA